MRVGIEVLGVGGFQDKRGHRFPQGGLDVTEGGQVIGGCHQGPHAVFYSAGSQSEKSDPFWNLHQPCLDGGGGLVPVSALVCAHLPCR